MYYTNAVRFATDTWDQSLDQTNEIFSFSLDHGMDDGIDIILPRQQKKSKDRFMADHTHHVY